MGVMRYWVEFFAGALSLVAVLVAWPVAAASLFGTQSAFGSGSAKSDSAIVQIRATPDDTVEGSAALGVDPAASLFADREGASMFRPIIRAEPEPLAPQRAFPRLSKRTGIPALFDLIATVEAGRAQYDAVVFSARIKTPKPPTQMTLAEIFKWIDDTPGQNHAIGRYQFIPKTLRYVVDDIGLKDTARFSPQVQDQLAMVLLQDAGVQKFLRSEMGHVAFMNNLARIWAGLPNSSGKSHYAGVAGNKAGMSWTKFEREMTRIFPTQVAAANSKAKTKSGS